VIELTLDFPPATLNPNTRAQWRFKAIVVKAYREACRVDALNARRAAEAEGVTFPLQPPVLATLTFVLSSQRRRDADNLLSSIKSGMDGLVDAGLLVDDDVKNLTISMGVEYGPKPGVRVRLEGAS
jgi:crossover junction endodeoxyribonuclease RusA